VKLLFLSYLHVPYMYMHYSSTSILARRYLLTMCLKIVCFSTVDVQVKLINGITQSQVLIGC